MNITINSNAIQAETEKALLIKVPKENYAFWYPKRFCNQSGKNDYQLHIWFGDNFSVDCYRLGTKTKVPVGRFLAASLLKEYVSESA